MINCVVNIVHIINNISTAVLLLSSVVAFQLNLGHILQLAALDIFTQYSLQLQRLPPKFTIISHEYLVSNC